MTYGYCRISTQQQSIERQIRNIIAAYPETRDKIYKEAYTGTSMDRPEWKKLVKKIEKGDTIVFDSVSRMSRAEEGVQVYMELMEKGVSLVFLKEPYINTSTYLQAANKTIESTGNDIADIYIEATNNVIKLIAKKQIEQAFAQSQKEVDDLHQRTKEGMKTAAAAGKQIGQKPGAKLTTKKSIEAKKKIEMLAKDFGGTFSDVAAMEMIGISRNTYYKYKSELREAAGME